MTFGTRYKQGDILLVPFPFTDLSAVKQRPVLVLSKDAPGKDLITCGITSNLHDRWNSVLLDQKGMGSGTLPRMSLIKVDKLFTIEVRIVKRKYGAVSKGTLQKAIRVFHSLV